MFGGIFENLIAGSQQQQPPATAPAAPPATTLPNNPSVTTASGPNTAGNGAVPADANNPPGQQGNDVNADKSPLAQWAEFWNNEATKGGEGEPSDPLAINPEALKKHVQDMNLASGISQELLTKVTAGGEEAASALLEAMNTVAQQVLIQSTLVGNQLAQRAAQHTGSSLQDQVKSMIKQSQVTASLGEANPAFNHPAVAPIVEQIKQNMATKFPNATPQELTQQAQQYVSDMAAAFLPSDVAASIQGGNRQQPSQDADENWGRFLDMS